MSDQDRDKLTEVINVRLSPRMVEELDRLAGENRRTRSNQILVLLSEALAEKKD